VLVYKLKQHSKRQTGLNYVIYIEMTDLKFSPTSKCNKTSILLIIFKESFVIFCNVTYTFPNYFSPHTPKN